MLCLQFPSRDARLKLLYFVQIGGMLNTSRGNQKIIGNSLALKFILEQIGIVALTDSTILLLGETGTGKEVLAHSIHERSARSDRKFVKVNCAATPSGLLESELFGHARSPVR